MRTRMFVVSGGADVAKLPVPKIYGSGAKRTAKRVAAKKRPAKRAAAKRRVVKKAK